MGKKKGGKKGKGNKKKAKDPSIRETYLAYQITIKEKDLEDILFEKSGLQNKVDKFKERNQDLMDEQECLFQNLRKQMKEWDKERDKIGLIGSADVCQTLLELWKYCQVEEESIQSIIHETISAEDETKKLQLGIDYWTEYESSGLKAHDLQINILKSELVDIETTFQEMAGFLEQDFDKFCKEIQLRSKMDIEKQKKVAMERAFENLDMKSKESIDEHKVLIIEELGLEGSFGDDFDLITIRKTKELQAYQSTLNDLAREIADVEGENLEILSFLFECRVEDLQISKNIFLTTIGDNENLDADDDDMLEVDLKKIDLVERTNPNKRPKSAIHKAVERRLMMIPQDYLPMVSQVEESFEKSAVKKESEQKLLCISGEKVVENPESAPDDELKRAMQSYHWPKNVSVNMLQKTNKGLLTTPPTPIPT